MSTKINNHPKTTRIIADTCHKVRQPEWGADKKYNRTIRAVNRMYLWLYQKGYLQKHAFVFLDYPDNTLFALDVADIAYLRPKMERAFIKDARLATQRIFDEEFTPCRYCGAIQLSWPMLTYRDVDGCTSSSWECDQVQFLITSDANDVAKICREEGVKAAVRSVYYRDVWQQTDSGFIREDNGNVHHVLPRYDELKKFYEEQTDSSLESYSFIHENFRELNYCFETQERVSDFQAWIKFQYLCNQTFSFDVYKALSAVCPGGYPHTVSKDDAEAVEGIKEKLNSILTATYAF